METKAAPRDQINVVGYIRVSTRDQAEGGYGLAAQKDAIEKECDRRGWTLKALFSDEGESGKNLDRPALRSALECVASGEASGLAVSKLDRLSRSVADFASLLAWFTDAGRTLIALDLGIDTSTPGGRLVANVFASVAEWEREVIAARTKDGLQAAREAGKPISGPALVDDEGLRALIEGMRESGMTQQAIADRLNADEVPTLRGGAMWRPSSIQSVAGSPRRVKRRRPLELPRAVPLG